MLRLLMVLLWQNRGSLNLRELGRSITLVEDKVVNIPRFIAPSQDRNCYHCGQRGHNQRDYPQAPRISEPQYQYHAPPPYQPPQNQFRGPVNQQAPLVRGPAQGRPRAPNVCYWSSGLAGL